MNNTTYMPKGNEKEEKWYVVDAENKVLGRLASQIAAVLRGKHRPTYTPFIDSGDHVIVVNADKVILTGKKRQQKIYYRHSGYPGGLKAVKYDELLNTRPELAIRLAVWGMLPHNRLGRKLIKKLRVYKGPEHPHVAQKPEPLEVDDKQR
ncbi:MAG: 50S ribosomal protein L13 [Firmicutes bacterium]|nr:50S ribosomal protein L13 [Bacillota bacterium]